MFTQTIDNEQQVSRPAPKEELYGLSVDTSVLFSDYKGIHRSGIEKHQRKLLSKLSFLAPFLEPGEKILQVISGCSPATFVEQLLTGVLLGPLKRSLFAITNRRIIHVPTNARLHHRYSVAQILYADCRYISLGWTTLVAKYKSGRTEKFLCIGRKGRKKARLLLKNMPLKGRTSPTLEREHLCPRCTTPLIKGYYACPACSLEFKKHSWATIMSIMFPGGGYFYARHPVVGTIEAFMETIVMLLLIASIVVRNISSPSAPRNIHQAILLCAIILGYQKTVTSLFSNKCIDEFIPKQKNIKLASDKKSQDPNKQSLATGWRSM